MFENKLASGQHCILDQSLWSNGTSVRSALAPETKNVTALCQQQVSDCVNCLFQNQLAAPTNIAIEHSWSNNLTPQGN